MKGTEMDWCMEAKCVRDFGHASPDVAQFKACGVGDSEDAGSGKG